MPLNYRDLQKRGRCVHCARKWSGAAKSCDRCRSYFADYAAKARKERLETGMCTTCGGPRDDPEKVMCGKCRKYFRTYYKARRRENVANGLCPCGNPVAPNRKACPRCLERNRRYSQKARAKQKEGPT